MMASRTKIWRLQQYVMMAINAKSVKYIRGFHTNTYKRHQEASRENLSDYESFVSWRRQV